MTRPAGVLDVRYETEMAVVRTWPQGTALAAFLVALAVLPFWAERSTLTAVSLMAIWVVAAHGLNLLTGYAGQISIGHAAFVGVGCYATAVLTTRVGLNYFLAVPLAGLVTAVVGVVFGLPSLRLKGFYLAMATLAAQVIITQAFLYVWPEMLGGALGISLTPPSLGGITFATPEATYWLVVGGAVVMTAAAKNIARTRTGRAFVAVRDNDLAAELMGIPVFRTKLAAFFLGCFFAGIAGALWAGFTWSARADQFPFIQSIWYLGVIIIGGMGSTIGPIFGVVMVRLLNEIVLHMTPWIGGMVPAEMAGPVGVGTGLSAFGLMVILFLIFEPRGIAHAWEIAKERARNWPFVYPPG
jgi:branched-chain amino acid transport system permease protein